MSKILAGDNIQEIIVKMSEGNPGAINVMCVIIKDAPLIDPQDTMPYGLGKLMNLDNYNIYGSSIYVLFNDKCHCDIRKFIILLRACQFGFLLVKKLQDMATDQMGEVNLTDEEWVDLDIKVCNHLLDFAPSIPTQSTVH